MTTFMERLLRPVRALALLLAILALPNLACGQRVGDRIVVSASFKTRIYDKLVDEVSEGEIRTIEQLNGKWCKLEGVEGWLPSQYAMSLNAGLQHFTRRIEAQPGDFIALAHRGMIYHELERDEQAFKDLNQSLTFNKSNPVTWMLRGIIYKSLGKYQEALGDFAYALKLNPQLSNAHFNMGLTLYEMGDFAQAIEAYDKAIAQNDKAPMWLVSRGSAYLNNQQLKQARDDYQQALKLDPQLADARIGLSQLAMMQMDYDTAIQEADEAVRVQPTNAMALNTRGWLKYKLGQVESALADLNQAIRYAPRYTLAYGNRGVCQVALGNFDAAIADHSQQIRLDPESPFAYSNRAVSYMAQGDFEKARADFEKAEALAPELIEALNGHAWFLATCPDEKFRNGEQAVVRATKACQESEFKNWYFLDTLAAAHAETGNFEEAVKYARMAVEVAPEGKKELCRKQLQRFENGEVLRSQVGKNAEQNLGGN